MSRTIKHQDKFDYLHDNKEIPSNRLYKLKNWFNRINFWNWDYKILYRKYKDYKHGGDARIKTKNYKNSK